MKHRPNEFSLHIRWRELNKGSYPRPATPGFYCMMGWDNEGEAEWLIEHELLNWSELAHIVQAVGESTGRPVTQVLAMEAFYETERKEQLQRLRKQADAIQAQIEALS